MIAKHVCIGIVVGWMSLGIASVTRGATWQNGDGAWDNSNTANWNPAVVPTTATAINLTQSSATGINIIYSATTMTGTEAVDGNRYGAFTLSNAGGGTTTLAIATGVLPCGSSYGNATLAAGGKLAISGGTFTPGGNLIMTGGELVQSGGLIQPLAWDLNMSGGTYTLSGGTSSFRLTAITPSSGTVTINQSGGSLITRIHSFQDFKLSPTATGRVIYNQSGGTNDSLVVTVIARITTNATYSLSGASSYLGMGHWQMSGGAYTQSAGTAKFTYDVSVEDGAAMSLSGGTITNNNLNIGTSGGTGTVVITGGSWVYGNASGGLSIGGASGSGGLIIKGGALAGGAGSGDNCVIGQTGLLQGYASISNTLFQTFSNSGRVIADGDGVDRVLDLSFFTGSGGANSVLNPTDNSTGGSNGWFAVNHGKLLLPLATIATGNSIRNWGEQDSDTAIDLVNSVRLALTNVVATGSPLTLSGALLATNRADIAAPPPAGYMFLSVHEFVKSGFNFSNVSVTIRYDPSQLASLKIDESSIKIRQYTGGAWVDVTSSLDAVNKLVTSSAVTTLGQFAVIAKLYVPKGTVVEIY